MVDIAPPEPSRQPKWKLTLQLLTGAFVLAALVLAATTSYWVYQVQLEKSKDTEMHSIRLEELENRLQKNLQIIESLVAEQNTYRENYSKLIQEVEGIEKALVQRIEAVEKEGSVLAQQDREFFALLQDVKASMRQWGEGGQQESTPTAWEAITESYVS